MHALSRFALPFVLATSLVWSAEAHPGVTEGAHAVTPVAIAMSEVAKHPTLTPAEARALPEITRRRLAAALEVPGAPPVLLPADPALLASAQAVIGPTWHAVSMREASYSVYVHASAAAINVPGVRRPPVRPPSLAVPRISRSHEIVTAHFVAWGVAWDVDIECLGGLDHPMCGDDVLIHELIRGLRRLVVGR